jgi:hypothetical protein
VAQEPWWQGNAQIEGNQYRTNDAMEHLACGTSVEPSVIKRTNREIGGVGDPKAKVIHPQKQFSILIHWQITPKPARFK